MLVVGGMDRDLGGGEIGIPDFAVRRGHHGGTLVLDRPRIVRSMCCPDCTTETTKTWLAEHAGTL